MFSNRSYEKLIDFDEKKNKKLTRNQKVTRSSSPIEKSSSQDSFKSFDEKNSADEKQLSWNNTKKVVKVENQPTEVSANKKMDLTIILPFNRFINLIEACFSEFSIKFSYENFRYNYEWINEKTGRSICASLNIFKIKNRKYVYGIRIQKKGLFQKRIQGRERKWLAHVRDSVFEF